ncbi:MAG: phosphoglycerate mutase family protein [Methylococcaceae bacterium]|nr:phosphoglycerate mutase family protein [Methylococcaceae bacterium]
MAKTIAALIRHGDYQQLLNTPSAHQPFPLTEKGFAQAHALALLIKEQGARLNCQINPVIACSRLLRAWQTADTLAQSLNSSEYSVQEYSDLAERSVGSAANLSIQQITDIVQQDPRFNGLPKGWKSDSHFCLPFQGAESLLDAGWRVATLLRAEMQVLQQQSQTDQIKIFVGHGAAFRHAAYYLGLLQYEQIAQLSMFHCQPIFIEYQNENSWKPIAGAWKERSAHSQFTD